MIFGIICLKTMDICGIILSRGNRFLNRLPLFCRKSTLLCPVRITEALVMNHFTLSQETNGIANVRVIDQAEKIVISYPRLLFRCKIFVKIRKYISLDTDILHVKGDAGCRDGIYAGCVIDEIHIEAGLFDFLFTQISGELIHNGCDHFKMCEFLSTGRRSAIAHREDLAILKRLCYTERKNSDQEERYVSG